MGNVIWWNRIFHEVSSSHFFWFGSIYQLTKHFKTWSNEIFDRSVSNKTSCKWWVILIETSLIHIKHDIARRARSRAWWSFKMKVLMIWNVIILGRANWITFSKRCRQRLRSVTKQPKKPFWSNNDEIPQINCYYIGLGRNRFHFPLVIHDVQCVLASKCLLIFSMLVKLQGHLDAISSIPMSYYWQWTSTSVSAFEEMLRGLYYITTSCAICLLAFVVLCQGTFWLMRFLWWGIQVITLLPISPWCVLTRQLPRVIPRRNASSRRSCTWRGKASTV